MNKLLSITAIAGTLLAASPAFAAWPNDGFNDYAPRYHQPQHDYSYHSHYQQYYHGPQRYPHGWQHHGIDARQQQQHWRIMQGVRSGALTRHEARELMDDYRDIQRNEHIYRADGYLSRDERRDLQRDLNELSRNIQREAHDRQRRDW